MPTGRASLSLAGWRFEFESVDGRPLAFPNSYSAFFSPPADGKLAASYRIHGPDALPWRTDELLETAWVTDTWRLDRTPSGDWRLSLLLWPDARTLPIAQFSPDFRQGDVLRRAGRHGAPTETVFNYPCDQVAVSNALLEYGVGVVHAGAVRMESGAILFCGPSGAGKTTLSRLFRSAGATLLNDDRQFVWIDRDRAFLAPTPWHGSEPEIHAHTAPLLAIFHLEHAPYNRAAALDAPTSAVRLLSNMVAPHYRPDAMERALALAEAVTERVPSYRLQFTPTHEAVRLCSEVAAGSAKTAMR